MALSDEDLARADRAHWVWCAVCQADVLADHAPPYVQPSTDEDSTVRYLQTRWDMWGSELLVLECGTRIVWAAVADMILQLHKGYTPRNATSALVVTARRMAKAVRRRGPVQA